MIGTAPKRSGGRPGAPDERPVLAVVTGHMTPYRVHYHERVAREIPELRLATLVTKAKTGPWENQPNAAIGTVFFEELPASDAPLSGSKRLWNEVRKGRRLVDWLESHKVAAVISIGYDEIPNVMALRWARGRAVPSFLWADSNIHSDRVRGLLRLFKRVYVPWATGLCTGVMVCGRLGRAFFNRYGVADSRIFVSPYEPDYSLIEQMTEVEASQRVRTMGIDPADGRRRIVCCCRLVHVKRVDLVIDAFVAMVRAGEGERWDLLVVGEGELKAELERRTPAEMLGSRVRFLGFRDQTSVTAIYRCSQVLVLASESEPWALVINEAAAAGLALVATERVGAAAELIRDGLNGRIVPADDGAALTDALREVTSNDRACEMGKASRRELLRWRVEGDPVRGLRAALAWAGVEALVAR